jgi:hypothetical protein
MTIMTRIYMSRRSARTLLAMAGLLALVLVGCAGVQPAPGPDTARIEIDLRATVDKAKAADALESAGFRWDEADRPLQNIRWEWGLYMLRSDGSLYPLPNNTGGRLRVVRQYPLQNRVTFYCPSGKVKLRLMVEGYTNRLMGEGWAIITLAKYHEDMDLSLAPGSSRKIVRRLGPDSGGSK